TQRPFQQIGKMLNTDEEEIMRIMRILKEQKEAGIIRQISPIYDTKRLGYKSSLIAFRVAPEKIDETIALINSHPGVSHNYERDHDFNIWFTMAVAPDSRLGLERTIELLAKKSGVEEYIMLPTLKLFKIAVKLDTTGKEAKKERVAKKVYKKIDLTPLHHKVIRFSQTDIDITPEPFKEIIERIGIDETHFFDTLEELKDAGIMRRFAGILNHRKAGFNANAMVVWDIDEAKAEEIGKKAAEFSAVSHCYLRPKYPNWPYNLFTMVHGKSKEEADAIIEEMASELEHRDKRPLYSTREFKKVRIKYFTPDAAEWEEKMIKENV
ncbi:MAG: AsnC family protein, partial [Campylobacteraceae bacterium 4484_4]